MKRCGTCGIGKPLSDFNRDRSQKDGFERRCRECAKEHNRRMKERHGDKMREKKNARHAERMKNDPEYRERIRRIHREGQRRRRSTPEGRRKMREEAAERYACLRSDPEAWAAFLEQRRETMRKIRESDPVRYADILEARRINRRLRRIENGEPVWWLKRKGTRVFVSAAPLRRLIEKRILVESAKALADEADVSVRVLRRMMNGGTESTGGTGERISIDTAEKLCVALDVPFSLIYEGEEDDE